MKNPNDSSNRASRPARPKWLLPLSIVIAAVVIGVAIVCFATAAPPVGTTIAPVTQASVDAANIQNGGVVAQGDGCAYYCNNGIWRKPDDGDAELLWDVYATSLVLHDGYLYFTDGANGNALYRRALSGGEAEQVTPFSTEYYAFSGENLFFMCAKRLEHRGIYRCDPDGANLACLSQTNCGLLMCYGGYLYYTDKDNGMRLLRMAEDGKNPQTVADEYVSCVVANAADDTLFYATLKSVMRCRPDGRGATELAKTPAYRLSLTGTSLLLSVYSYSGKGDYETGIFRLDSDGAAPVLLNEDQTSILCLGSGKLYYKSVSNGLTLMRSELDGSARTYVASGAQDSVFDQIDEASRDASGQTGDQQEENKQ